MSSSTATPDMAMKPMAAEIENGMSRSQSAATPPTQANGTAVKTMATSRRLENVSRKRAKINRNARDSNRFFEGST